LDPDETRTRNPVFNAVSAQRRRPGPRTRRVQNKVLSERPPSSKEGPQNAHLVKTSVGDPEPLVRGTDPDPSLFS
jgi:hypothetical protein